MTERQKEPYCELYAKAYLLDESNLKLDFIETVPETEQFRVREHLREVGANIFKTALSGTNQKYNIKWNGLYIIIQFFAPMSSKLSISDLVSSFHKAASDTYLEGDAKVYEDKNIAFDNFKVIYKRKKGTVKQKIIKYDDYWQWKRQPPKIKEWDMWVKDVSEEKIKGKDSISIRGNTNVIPFAKERVTEEKIIWYEQGEDDPSIAIFSRKGFNVSDVISAIQDIITQEYETKLAGILHDDDELVL